MDNNIEIDRLSRDYNVPRNLILASMSDGFALDVIADWIANGKDLLNLE